MKRPRPIDAGALIDKRAVCPKCDGTSGIISRNANDEPQEWQAQHYRCRSCGYNILEDPESLILVKNQRESRIVPVTTVTNTSSTTYKLKMPDGSLRGIGSELVVDFDDFDKTYNNKIWLIESPAGIAALVVADCESDAINKAEDNGLMTYFHVEELECPESVHIGNDSQYADLTYCVITLVKHFENTITLGI
jgi:MinD superfamily P-loop ATPase